jgi:hypothetical protein
MFSKFLVSMPRTSAINIHCKTVRFTEIYTFWAVLRIHGAKPLTSRFGSGPSIFVIDLQDANKKLIFIKRFFCLLLFEGTFTSFFKYKKSKSSHKTVGIKVFLPIFA